MWSLEVAFPGNRLFVRFWTLFTHDSQTRPSMSNILSLTSGKNFTVIRSVVILPPVDQIDFMEKFYKTLSFGTNHKCSSLLTWPAKSFAPPAYRMTLWLKFWFLKLVCSTLINLFIDFTSIAPIISSNLHWHIDFTCQFSWKFF